MTLNEILSVTRGECVASRMILWELMTKEWVEYLMSCPVTS